MFFPLNKTVLSTLAVPMRVFQVPHGYLFLTAHETRVRLYSDLVLALFFKTRTMQRKFQNKYSNKNMSARGNREMLRSLA